MRPRTKNRVLLAGGIFCLVLITALAAGSIFLNRSAFRTLILEKINASIDGRLVIGGHRLDVIAGRLVLSDIQLNDIHGNLIGRARRLEIQWRWYALLRRSLHISSLVIDEPLLAVVYDQQDRMNLLNLVPDQAAQDAESADGAAGWQVRLDDLRIENGQATFDRPSTHWRGHAGPIDVSASGDLFERIADVRVSIGNLAVHLDETAGSLGAVVLSARYLSKAARPIHLKIQTSESEISAEGRLDVDRDRPEATAVLDFDLNLEEIQQWLPPASRLSGKVEGRVTLNGPLDDPRAALRLAMSDASGWETPLHSLQFEALLDRRVIVIERFSADDQWGKIALTGRFDLRPVFPHSFRQPAAGLASTLVQLDLKGHDLIPGQIEALAFPWEGVWQGHVRLDGSAGESMSGSGQAEVELRVAQLKGPQGSEASDGHMAAYLRWADRKLSVDSCQVTVGDTTLQANGALDWRRRRLVSQATLRSERIHALGTLIGATLPAGSGLLKLDIKGPWERPLGHAALLVQDATYDDWRFGHLLVEADLKDDGALHLSKVVLENRGSYMEGTGRLEVLDRDGRWLPDPGLEARLDLDHVALSDFQAGLAADVSLNGRVLLRGTVAHPHAAFNVDSGAVSWTDMDALVDGRILWDDGDLTVSAVHLLRGQSNISLQGALKFRDPKDGQWLSDPQVHAELNADTMHLADFIPDFGGRIALNASLTGRLSNLRGSYRLAGSDLDLVHQKLDAVHLEGRLADDIVHLDRLAVSVAPGQEVVADGWYAFDRRFEAKLTTMGLDVRHIDGLQKGGPVEGRLEAALNAGGTLDNPRLSGRVLIRQPRIHGQSWDDFRLDLALNERRLTVDADLTFKLTAAYHLDSGDFDLSAALDRTELAPYLALVAGEHWTGRLSGRLQAKGNRRQPEKIVATVVLSDARLIYHEVSILSFEKVEADLRNGIIDLPETRMRLMQDGYLSVTANGEMKSTLSVQIGGRLPLAALEPFSDAIGNASGNIQFQMAGQGSWERMQWQGEVTLEKLRCMLTDAGQTIHDLNGRIHITPDRLNIETISGKLDDGVFKINGGIQLAERRPVEADVRIEARALPIQWPDTMDVKISADLTFKGDARDALLEGRVVLLEGVYYKDLQLNLLSTLSDLTEPQRGEPLPSQWEAPAWMENIRLNIEITHRYPLLVDNNVARLEVVPDLKLVGTAARPILNGRAYVAEGEIIFRKKSFAVKRGVVDFLNPYRIEPTLDIQAETQIRTWKIRLSAEGTPQLLKVRLSSDPPESDANILSLIVFGQTSSEFSGSGGGTTTGQMLAALASSAWGEDVRKGTGMDILEVETGGGEESDDRIELTVGKKLTSRLTLKYALESKNNQLVQKAISEYRLLEHMSASGFQDTAGNYGGELLFRIEFR